MNGLANGTTTVTGAEAEELLGLGLYTFSEAAMIVSAALAKVVTRTNLTRWALGRKALEREYAPIISSHLKIYGAYLVTFSDLIELFTIAALRERKISLATIRNAYERACQKYGKHPFASRQYFHDGKGIFSPGDGPILDMEELNTGRLAFQDIVEPLLRNVAYGKRAAIAFAPLGEKRTVILDPERSFGSPIDRKTGIRTAILSGMYRSGETAESVARWYGVGLDSVHDAIEYEESLRKAA